MQTQSFMTACVCSHRPDFSSGSGIVREVLYFFVSFDMPSHGILVCECPATQITNEWLFSSVNSHVWSQVRGARKVLITYIACDSFIWLGGL